jgi:curved DNA-binding protein CbpA
MNYYQELGLSFSAAPEEIREAYRNLVRLLHPDQQQDPVLKELAGCQMKRINLIYEVLADPERRRRYDSGIASEGVERQISRAIKTPPPAPPSPARPSPARKFDTVAWLATALAGIAGISWDVAQQSGHDAASTAAYSTAPNIKPAKETVQVRPSPAPRAVLPPVMKIEVPVRSPEDEKALAQRTEQLTQAQNEILALKTEREKILEQLARQSKELNGKETDARSARLGDQRDTHTAAAPAATLAPVPAAPAIISARIPPPPVSRPAVEPQARKHFAGTWFYPRSRIIGQTSLYAPEYIEAVIAEANGSVRGRYRARYRVSDKPISPNVAFLFEGRPKGNTANLLWSASGGARGEVQLRLVSENSLEVVWTATDMGKELGLASGTAILVRQREP